MMMKSVLFCALVGTGLAGPVPQSFRECVNLPRAQRMACLRRKPATTPRPAPTQQEPPPSSTGNQSGVAGDGFEECYAMYTDSTWSRPDVSDFRLLEPFGWTHQTASNNAIFTPGQTPPTELQSFAQSSIFADLEINRVEPLVKRGVIGTWYEGHPETHWIPSPNTNNKSASLGSKLYIRLNASHPCVTMLRRADQTTDTFVSATTCLASGGSWKGSASATAQVYDATNITPVTINGRVTVRYERRSMSECDNAYGETLLMETSVGHWASEDFTGLGGR